MMTKAKAGGRPVKVPTTPEVVSKVQSITAKQGKGKPAPWVGNLQRAVAPKKKHK
jgi:hypothetical protein